MYDVLVVGGGVNGLATAWQLSRRGAGRVGVLDQHPRAHAFGSSHGIGRVTRSAYGHPTYVRLMAIAHEREWPALEAVVGEPLIHRTGGCIFGPPAGAFHTYSEAVAAGGVEVEHLTPEAATASE